jgi:acyl-CoA synthetase (NDP forming)
MTMKSIRAVETSAADVATWGDAAFTPRSVALVGASGKAGKHGHVLMKNILAGYGGTVYPINPNEKEIEGLPAYPRVRDAPGPVDLAVIVVPPQMAPDVIDDCAAARVRAAVLLSGGFAETGPDGLALQNRLAAAARAGGVRLIGPNCFGLINVAARLNASLSIGLPEPGGVSLFTQSGAYGMAAFSHSKGGGIGFAKVISAGNKADIDEVDVLRYFGDDPDTRVVAMFLESIRDGRALAEAARAITPRKPVIVLKTGRGQAAQRAAASHTAALAGDYAVAEAAMRQAGIRLVEDGLTLLDVAAALDRQPPLKGRRVAVITNSGGTGVELIDLMESQGLVAPKLSLGLESAIRQHLPAYGSAGNPIDVTTDWPRFAEMYGQSLKALLVSDEVDAVVPVLLQRSALMPEVTARVIAEVAAARRSGCEKPVHVCWVGAVEAEENRRALNGAGIPCHPWTARTALTLAHCRDVPARPAPPAPPPLPAPHGADGAGWLPAAGAFALLENAGVRMAPWRMAATADAAVAAAEALGFPVVLKAERPGLVHKTEAGAVCLGLDGAAAVRAAAQDFATRLGPGPLLVQKQMPRGVELVIGATRDPSFGPVVLFGLGGMWVEVLKDTALRMAPFGEAEAAAMIDGLRGRALLDGARGQPAVDRTALARLLAGVSVWLARAPWLAELDINPLIATPGGLVAVDARIRVR